MVNPARQPNAVPHTPMINPCMLKIFMMLARVAPIDFKIAMSLALSMTTMNSVLMMLNAATRIIRIRMMNMVIFSSLSAENRFLFICIQPRAK